VNREGNRDTSTLDLAILFGMPVAIAVLCVAIYYFAIQLNAALVQ
jgi:hypothetical protein